MQFGVSHLSATVSHVGNGEEQWLEAWVGWTKGVKHVMTRVVTATDPVSPVITVGCMWTQRIQDETTEQPCQTRGQLRGTESGHSGTPGVPYLIVPWCRWSHFLAIVHCLHCATAQGGCTSNSGNGFPVTMLCPARQVSSGTRRSSSWSSTSSTSDGRLFGASMLLSQFVFLICVLFFLPQVPF